MFTISVSGYYEIDFIDLDPEIHYFNKDEVYSTRGVHSVKYLGRKLLSVKEVKPCDCGSTYTSNPKFHYKWCSKI